MFSAVEDAIIAGDYSSAATINSGLVTATLIEQNQQTMNDLILRPLLDSNYIYTGADSSVLASIAAQCPVAGGDAVAQARNLLMSITNSILEFPDDCLDDYRNLMQKLPVNPSENAFKLYPNPNNGNMLLDYSLTTEESGELVIYDVTGKLVDKYYLTASNKQLIVNNDQLNNGIYLYRINVNERIVQKGKLVIIK